MSIVVTLSAVLLLQRVGDVENTIPTLLIIVVALLVPLPLRLVGIVVGISAINLLVAEIRLDFGVDPALMMLVFGAMSAVIFFTQTIRRHREAHALEMQQKALRSADEIMKNAERSREMQERLAQDEKLRSLGSLAGGVVHDLNNLLVPIVGNADLLLNAKFSPEQQVPLTEILRAAQAASHLTDQLNAFAGGTDGPREVLDLVAEVNTIEALVWRGLGDNVELVRVMPEHDVPVFANRAQLHQIVANLITNAAEALDENRSGEIQVVVEHVGQQATLRVADNGPGIAPEIAQHIFEPFQSTKGKGRGMGLAAVHGAVRRLEGEISVDTSSLGTEVTITLPISEKAITPVKSLKPQAFSNLSVLVVDDEFHVRETIARQLRSLDIKVASVNSGEAAIAELRAGVRPDLLVMDVRMPGMGGIRALHQIREIVAQQPVVLCTGYSQSQLSALADDPRTTIVGKPVSQHDLAAAMTRVLAA